MGCGEDIGRDDLFEQPSEFLVGELDAVELLELFAKICFETGSVSDVVAITVFQLLEL
ncbi:hypothetical protein D3C71_2215140 [compost metagenome]